jgi:apolipoprotein N-acyltransferase
MVALPSAWVMAEAVRSWPSLGGPWASLGASQWNQPATLASASLGGVWLTSFVIVGANTAIAGVILLRRVSARVIAAAVALACAGLGPAWFWLGPAPPAGSTVRVALVQPGNIQDSVARQAAGEALTAALVGRRLDLVVWGESSVGVDLTGQPAAMTRLADLSRRVGADLLVNVDARDRTGGIYKSSVLIGPNGSRGAYSKTRLVPFGEYVPLRPLLGWVTRFTKAAAVDRHRGTRLAVLPAGKVAVGPLICFESAFPDLARNLAADGADLVVVQTADTTFQGSWGLDQHASLSAVRAVESGRPVLQAALSGTSAAFDARGRRLAWAPGGWRGAAVVELPLSAERTPYVRAGDVVPLACWVALAVGAVTWWLPGTRRRGRRRARRGPPSA